MNIEVANEVGSFIAEGVGIPFHGWFTQPIRCETTLFPPSERVLEIGSVLSRKGVLPLVVIRCICNPTTGKNEMEFEEHFLAGGDNGAVGDHQVFGDVRI